MERAVLAEINYELVVEDSVALQRFYLSEVTNADERRRNRVWFVCVASAAVLGLTLSVMPWGYGVGNNLRFAFIATPFIVLLVGLIPAYRAYQESPAAIRRKMHVSLEYMGRSGRARTHGERRLVVTDEGFHLFGDGFESFNAWRIVPRILRDFDHLYICESFTKQLMSCHIVPGLAFQSQSSFAEFCQLVQQTWRAAQVDAAASVAERSASATDAHLADRVLASGDPAVV